MKTLHISVVGKVATYRKLDGDIVCDNDSYQIEFSFDSEWNSYSKKIAVFRWNSHVEEVEFFGNLCRVPVIKDATFVQVGVYIDNLSSTETIIPAKLSAQSLKANKNETSEPEVHVHEYTGCEKYNLSQHLKKCSCGDTIYENHAWNSGVITVQPTYETEGNKRYTCGDCGQTKDEVVSRIPKPAPTFVVYHGSLMKTVDLTKASNIEALNSESDTKNFDSTFRSGTNRFVVAFPATVASFIKVSDTTQNFGYTLSDTELIRQSDVSINGVTYRVYAYTVAANKADRPMYVSLS